MTRKLAVPNMQKLPTTVPSSSSSLLKIDLDNLGSEIYSMIDESKYHSWKYWYFS